MVPLVQVMLEGAAGVHPPAHLVVGKGERPAVLDVGRLPDAQLGRGARSVRELDSLSFTWTKALRHAAKGPAAENKVDEKKATSKKATILIQSS